MYKMGYTNLALPSYLRQWKLGSAILSGWHTRVVLLSMPILQMAFSPVMDTSHTACSDHTP